MSTLRKQDNADGLPKKAGGWNRINWQYVLRVWRAAGIPSPELEVEFHPDRKWRFDAAWWDRKVALEVQGGLFAGKPCPYCGRRPGGRHNDPVGMLKEYEKLNAAAALGWRVLYVVPDQLTMTETIDLLRDVLLSKA